MLLSSASLSLYLNSDNNNDDNANDADDAYDWR